MTVAEAQVTLLAPGLAGPADPGTGNAPEASRVLAADLVLPGLSRLVSRSRAVRSPLAAHALDGLLFESLGVVRPQDGDWPSAALSRLAAHADGGEGVWMHADPVHLRADMGKLILFSAAALAVSLDDADAITRWLNAHEHAPGPVLEPTHASAWHVRLDALPEMRTTGPDDAHGRDVTVSLPTGPDARDWHGRMNNIQMLLHQCPRNEAREGAGQAAVNSLWFWGAGALPPPPGCPWSGLWGDNHRLAGVARWCGVPVHRAVAGAADWLAAQAPGHALVVVDGLAGPARDTDIGSWRDALVDLDRRWLAPLVRALWRGRIARLAVHAGGGCGASVTTRDVRRWWRRDRAPGDALAALRGPLAGGGA